MKFFHLADLHLGKVVHGFSMLAGQRYVLEHSRLRIPVLMSAECPPGHQALDGYLLPVNLAAGATFQPELLYEAGKVLSLEALEEDGVVYVTGYVKGS